MSEVREEYTRETYPSFGKKYNDEKAIISLTSWRARINTVSKTLFSLLKQCPGFHIVLVLSEEEFPKMMDEMPENLKLFADNEMIEFLWVYKNYKSLKKILFTMDKYKDLDIPIISSDDDALYKYNYALELYNYWLKNKNSLITSNNASNLRTSGAFTLYSPNCFGVEYINELNNNKHLDIYTIADDAFYEMLRCKYNKNIKIINLRKNVCSWINADKPLHSTYTKKGFLQNVRKIQYDDLKFDICKIIGKDR